VVNAAAVPIAARSISVRLPVEGLGAARPYFLAYFLLDFARLNLILLEQFRGSAPLSHHAPRSSSEPSLRNGDRGFKPRATKRALGSENGFGFWRPSQRLDCPPFTELPAGARTKSRDFTKRASELFLAFMMQWSLVMGNLSRVRSDLDVMEHVMGGFHPTAEDRSRVRDRAEHRQRRASVNKPRTPNPAAKRRKTG
jgi:hypothetical protein